MEITSVCTIKQGEIRLNGSLLYQHSNYPDDQGGLFKDAYGYFDIQYPRFFKMDPLCKLAFLAFEFLVPFSDVINRYKSSEVGVVLNNRTSSILTDIRHQATIQDSAMYYPSPAVFVYSLPNIMIGELCIRHKISGENTLLVSDKFDEAIVSHYAQSMFLEGSCKACLCGWVDASTESFEANVFVTESSEEYRTHRKKTTNEEVTSRHCV